MFHPHNLVRYKQGGAIVMGYDGVIKCSNLEALKLEYETDWFSGFQYIGLPKIQIVAKETKTNVWLAEYRF